ncbi:hypothetical protein [Marivita sp. GX14005]|uniref:hypothetical protein n=1 Tax=Marivita sp. GX14005 TaxID=2942276 RepID=UPI0020192E37|nr:hypothetical protein [Marivita sp. GX14005]MCL3881735.1 hypothetical protein [Marivita sp. GX14005]
MRNGPAPLTIGVLSGTFAHQVIFANAGFRRMIVSHRYRLIFIKTLKSAGTSIELELSRHCGPTDIITPIFPKIDGHVSQNWRGVFPPWREVRSAADLRKNVRECVRRDRFYNHIPARFAKARMPPKIWISYLKVCVERNPWDKTLSHYHMFRNAAWHRHHDPELTLDRYLANGILCHNAPFYCDASGKPLVDRVLRFDRLNDDLAELCDEIGLPFGGLPHAKGDLRRDGRKYKDVLTEKQASEIARAFTHEIALHGWEY